MTKTPKRGKSAAMRSTLKQLEDAQKGERLEELTEID